MYPCLRSSHRHEQFLRNSVSGIFDFLMLRHLAAQKKITSRQVVRLGIEGKSLTLITPETPRRIYVDISYGFLALITCRYVHLLVPSLTHQ